MLPIVTGIRLSMKNDNWVRTMVGLAAFLKHYSVVRRWNILVCYTKKIKYIGCSNSLLDLSGGINGLA
jgi:hypothetical protein